MINAYDSHRVGCRGCSQHPSFIIHTRVRTRIVWLGECAACEKQSPQGEEGSGDEDAPGCMETARKNYSSNFSGCRAPRELFCDGIFIEYLKNKITTFVPV